VLCEKYAEQFGELHGRALAAVEFEVSAGAGFIDVLIRLGPGGRSGEPLNLIIEAKSLDEAISGGDVLRQLRMYASSHYRGSGELAALYLVTSHELSEAALRILRASDVRVVAPNLDDLHALLDPLQNELREMLAVHGATDDFITPRRGRR
jgi:hypothetical protein